MENFDGSFNVSVLRMEGNGMPNGYAFVIVLILIALVGGLVWCGFTINELQTRITELNLTAQAITDQAAACQTEKNSCQTELQNRERQLAEAEAIIQQLKAQSASGPVVPATPAAGSGAVQSANGDTNDASNLGRVLTILAASLGAGGSGLAYLRRGWRLAARKEILPRQRPAAAGLRSYYLKVTDEERAQLVKQRRNRG